MKQQLFVLCLLTFLFLFTGLVTVSGTVVLVALPPVLYLLGGFLLQPGRPDLLVERTITPAQALPGQRVQIRLRLENRGQPLNEVRLVDRVPVGLKLVDGEPATSVTLARGEEAQWSYTLEAIRGSYTFAGVVAEVAGLLPTRSRRYEIPSEQELVTLPDHKALSRIPIAPRRTLVYSGTNPARTGGEGTEFFDVQESRGAESPRHVNWRATAKSGRVYVNLFQQERVADVAVMLDCRTGAYPAGSHLFEAAATAAASMADAIIDAGNRVGYLAHGLMVDWIAPGFGKIQRQKILTRIARSSPGESAVFRSLASVPERLFPQGSQIVVVSPLGTDDVAALERMLAFGYAVLVVSPDPTPFRRQAGSRDVAASNYLMELERAVLMRRLRHAGVAVIDWDTREPLELAVAQSLRGVQAVWRRRGR